MSVNQTDSFESESKRYFDKNRNVSDVRVFPESLNTIRPSNILDVGCGNGAFLHDWVEHYKIKKGVGVEPSFETVEALREQWQNHESLHFERSFAHRLPFNSDEFEIVTCWSALTWVGRNEFLQSIGELIRVCSSYLVIMDFFPSSDYRTPYTHWPGNFTYKVDFEPIVLASGIMEAVEKSIWWVPPGSDSREILLPMQLSPFLQNELNFHSRKMVVFKKNYDLLPVLDEVDFAQHTA